MAYLNPNIYFDVQLFSYDENLLISLHVLHLRIYLHWFFTKMDNSQHPLTTEKSPVKGKSLYVSPTEEELKPAIGMCFNSLDEVHKFYNRYAKNVGFSIRKGNSNLSKVTREVIGKNWYCSKQGYSVCNGKRKHQILREQCPAYIRVYKGQDEKWVISRFVEEHSHMCVTPRKVHYLRSQRVVSSTQKALFETCSNANIKPSQYMAMLEIEAGGPSNVGFIEKDIRNYHVLSRKERKHADAHDLLCHFEELKEMNDSFYYAYEVDEDNKLVCCFWADGISRRDYKLFGDVVVFDTTYETNKYCLIFAPFTGVNHNKQSISFGCRFLRDEKAESFVWLFKKFLEAMSGQQPKAIVTDQDAAMALAIVEAFHETHHRYCMWHILKKESDKLGAIAKNESFIEPFHACVWGSDTIREFEHHWVKIMAENDLTDNEWLCSLYEIRDMWIPVYFKHVFLAGIRTTQRSESVNAFIDKYVSKKNTLMEFIHRIERAIKRLRHNEMKYDFVSENSKPSLVTPFNIEKQMGATYSRHIFTKKFQVELLESTHCLSTLKKNDETSSFYDVKMPGDRKCVREVEFYASQEFACCSCMMFESEGIPCRHILLVLRNNGIDTLPTDLILKRWTIFITKEFVYDSHGTQLRGDNEQVPEHLVRKGRLNSIMADWVDKACLNNITFSTVEEMMMNIGKVVDEITPKEYMQESQDRLKEVSTTLKAHPPNISKTKGSGRRLKSAKEIAMEEAAKGGRLCHGCNLRGQGHDIRNCPVAKAMREE